MAFTSYIFLFFCMLSQITNVAHSANNEISDDITQLGFNNATVIPANYKNNVNSLLSVFITESSRGFFNTSSGSGSDRAYGSYLCRGDLDAKECNNCLQRIKQFFSNSQINRYYLDGLVYNGQLKCVVHYSNSSASFVFKLNSTFAIDAAGDSLSEPKYSQYSVTLLQSLSQHAKDVGEGKSTNPPNYAASLTVMGGTQKLDTLVQCVRDISAMNCSSCIQNLYNTVPLTKVAGAVINPYCFIRYDNKDFINSGYPSFMPSYFHVFLVLLGSMYLSFM